MSGCVNHQNSTTLCAHGGCAESPSPNPRVKLGGNPVVLQPIPHLVSGCGNPVPPANVGPCVSATWMMGALRVKVLGQPLLLQTSPAIATPTGTPLNVAMTQLRVKAM